MTRITACPKCQTRFRVSEAQLQARHGNVRCGRCAQIFNALETLAEGAVPPSPAAPAIHPQQAAPEKEDTKRFAAHETQEAPKEFTKPEFHPEISPSSEPLGEPAPPAEAAAVPQEHFPAIRPDESPSTESGKEAVTAESSSGDTDLDLDLYLDLDLELDVDFEPGQTSALETKSGLEPEHGYMNEPEQEQESEDSRFETRVVRIQPTPASIQPKVSPERPKYAPPPKPKRAWPWVLANLLLMLALSGQGIYSFRDSIAAHYPATRPLLEQMCGQLNCRVNLPRNPDLISIESSELHAHPERANIVVLSSLLRNRAPHVQAYPMLELTLTNARDEMVARKLFPPGEYLRNPATIPQGIMPSAEISVKLLMDLGNLKAEGYRLYLFYPS